MSARRTLRSDLKPAVEIKVEVFFNGGTRVACVTMGEPATAPQAPPAEGEGEEAPGDAEEAGTPEQQHAQNVDATIKYINEVVGPSVEGIAAKSTRELDDKLKELPAAPTTLTSLALAEAGAFCVEEPLFLFVAKAVQELLQQGEVALGGGHLVDVPSAKQLELDDEKPAPAAPDAEPAGSVEGEGEAEKPFVPQGLPVRLPALLFPAFSVGPTVDGAESKVRFKKLWLMSPHDAPLREAVPRMTAAYRALETAMAAKAREAPPEEGEAGEGGARVADDDGFFLAPKAENVGEILGLIEAAVTAAGLVYGEDVLVCVNMGAHDFFVPNSLEVGTYAYRPEGEAEGALSVEADGWADWVCSFLDSNPAVAAIEDVAANEDYETWRKVRLAVEAREKRVTLLGADLYDKGPTNVTDLYRAGVAEGWAAGAVLSAASLGTLSDVLDNATMFTAIRPPARALRVLLAHRAGERAGEADADVAVGIGAWGLKCGPPCAATVGKLNRLLWIEEQLETMLAAAKGGQPEALMAQTAHLQRWEQVYEEEDRLSAMYAAEAQEASMGP